MEVKTYYANTVEAAFSLARQEFGAEAMLLESKLAVPGMDRRGKYEVVFAGEPQTSLRPSGEIQPFSPKVIQRANGAHMPELVRPARVSGLEIGSSPIDLVRRPVTPGKVRNNENAAPLDKRRSGQPAVSAVCNSGLSRFEAPSYSIALVGPAGAGKTTTAMKIAVRYGLLRSRACRILAYDPERVGTTERLRHFSDLLRIPFESVESLPGLGAALSLRTQGLTIIDTPGCARTDDDMLTALSSRLGAHREVETQLVLRADRRLSDNVRAASRLSCLAPKRLIVTGLDETEDYRDIEKLAIKTALPLSFFGIGQTIPDDIEPATLQRLQDLVDHGWSRGTAAAA